MIYLKLKKQRGVRFLKVPGWEGYLAGDDGSAWCCKNRAGRITRRYRKLACPPDKRGYRRFTLSNGKNKKNIFVAPLIAMLFIGPRPRGKLVCHEDDNRTNDKLSNLYYGTHKSNADDANRNGRIAFGMKHPMAKYSKFQVMEVRKIYKDTGSPTLASRQTGVCIHSVRKIVYQHHQKSQWRRY